MVEIVKGVYPIGVSHAERKLFDELIELDQGTSYNAYLVKGSEKTALIDTADSDKTAELLANISALGVENIDYIIANHAEQDHSGSILAVLEVFPKAKIVTNEKCKIFLKDLLFLEDDLFKIVNDEEVLSLGDKSLKFILTPWTHWPETMVTYLVEDQILFSCDLFGAHMSDPFDFAPDRAYIENSAKRYYAEIMMPFRIHIQKHLDKLSAYSFKYICPSHGPMYDKPEIILDLYREWVSDEVKDKVVIFFVSMHHSVSEAVAILEKQLKEKGLNVQSFNIAQESIATIAMEAVDAATIVLGTPTVLAGVHPKMLYAVALLNLLRVKTRYLAIINSFGWGGRTVEIVKDNLKNLKAELLEPVSFKGRPKEEDKQALADLATAIVEKHKSL